MNIGGRKVPDWALGAIVTLAYFGAAKGGLALAFANQSITAVWAPTGIALATLLLCGRRFWPAVAAGAFLANVTTSAPLGAVFGITVGNTLEAVIGAWAISRVQGFDRSLERIKDVVALVVFGALLSTMVSATFGVASLRLSGALSTDELLSAWRVWWFGDLGGDLIVAPALLVWASRPWIRRPLPGLAPTAATAAGLLALTVVVFSSEAEFAYPILPLMFFIGLVYGQAGATLSSLVVGGFAIWFTARGQGPFIGGSQDAELLRAQAFVGIASVTGLLTAAFKTERQQLESAMRRLRDSERKLAEAQHLAQIGSWEWDLIAGRFSWSVELHRILGVGSNGRTGYEVFLERVHPDDRWRVDEAIQTAIDDNAPFAFEHRIVRPDGEVRTLLTMGEVITYSGDEPALVRGTGQDITERKDAQEQLEHQALHDPLTGLPNRILLLDRLENALARARRAQTDVAVLFLDLDEFKIVNDSLGHDAGDELLIALPPRLREALRPGDTVARFGGDEFVLLCEEVEGAAGAVAIAQGIAETFARPFALQGREHFTTASTGVVVVENGAASGADVLRDADSAMYRAKHAGPGRYELFDDEMRAQLLERINKEAELRRAVERGELGLVYQPVFSLRSERIVSAEALLRWNHPAGTVMRPGDFISVAERSGLIVEIGEWTIAEVCRQSTTWQQQFPDEPPIRLSVNLSASQMTRSDVVATVSGSLRRAGLQPGILELEITESILLEDSIAAIDTLRDLKVAGARLVLDDFGTGYSSLSYLNRLPIDALKIDQSFVAGLRRNSDEAAIVAAVIRMAEALELAVIAEGVETEAQLLQLREKGCDFAQGNYLSPPVSSAELGEMLAGGGVLVKR